MLSLDTCPDTVKELNRKKKLALIAIDEAHLVSEWGEFYLQTRDKNQ